MVGCFRTAAAAACAVRLPCCLMRPGTAAPARLPAHRRGRARATASNGGLALPPRSSWKSTAASTRFGSGTFWLCNIKRARPPARPQRHVVLLAPGAFHQRPFNLPPFSPPATPPPAQLPAPCFNVFEHDRTAQRTHFCATCLLPHLGLQARAAQHASGCPLLPAAALCNAERSTLRVCVCVYVGATARTRLPPVPSPPHPTPPNHPHPTPHHTTPP